MSILRHAALAALPLLAGAALAQTPPKPAPQPPHPPAGAQQSIPGVSAAGNAIAMQKLHQSDPMLKQLYLQLRDTSTQIQLEAQRPTINADLLGTLIKKLDVLQSQFHAKQADAIVLALHALPEADRAPFVRAVVLGGRTAAAGAAPAH